MPAALIGPIIGAGIGAGGSAAAGKKGKNAQGQANQIAQQELGLQQQQFGLQKQQVGLGNQSLGQAGGFWGDLLKGGQAAVQATGPYASMIGQNAEGARNAITSLTPRGGEQNLALAQNYNQSANNIARLYAGMQPLAAGNLANIGSAYMGSGQQFNPFTNIGAGAGLIGQQMGLASQAGQGFGGLLYNAINKGLQSGAGKQRQAFPNMSPGAISGSYGGPGQVPIIPGPINTNDWGIG